MANNSYRVGAVTPAPVAAPKFTWGELPTSSRGNHKLVSSHCLMIHVFVIQLVGYEEAWATNSFPNDSNCWRARGQRVTPVLGWE